MIARLFYCKVKDMTQKIVYNPDTAFIAENNAISLKPYSSDLVSLLHSSFDLVKADSILTPIENIGNNTLEDYGAFPDTKRISVRGSLSYHESNFQKFKEGTIRLRVKTEKYAGYSEQRMKGIHSLAEDNSYYAFGLKLTINGVEQVQDVIVHLVAGADLEEQINEIYISIQTALGENEELTNYSHIVSVSSDDTDIILATIQPGYKLEITNPVTMQGQACENLLTLFTSISTPFYMNAPENDITFFALEGIEDYIRIIHKTDGNIYANIHGVGEVLLCSWNKTYFEWMELEVSFNEQLIFVLKDGTLKNIIQVSGILRELPRTNMVLTGTEVDTYSFDEIVLFSEIQHTKNYTLSTSHMPVYPIDNPYVDIHYGAIRLYDDKSISISYVGDIGISLYSGTRPIIGGDTFVSSLPVSTFITSFEEEVLNDYSDLIFKVFFHSDGYAPATLTSLDLNIGTEILDEDSTNPANFNQVFDFIRRSLGYPRVPVELTDDQLLDALNQSVFQYNRYRNYDVNMEIHNTATLERHVDGGFYLPPGIGKDDIIEILFRPRYSWSWYSGDNSLMANIYMQNLFSGFDLSRSAADYYINITTQNDLKNLLGNQSGWHIMNGRLYLFPVFEGLETMNIGIKYRETISIEEINTNVQIQQLALAYAKITLGTIRSTFGDQIPGGDAMVQLNGNSLIQQGQAERDMLIQEFMKQQPVFGFMWT